MSKLAKFAVVEIPAEEGKRGKRHLLRITKLRDTYVKGTLQTDDDPDTKHIERFDRDSVLALLPESPPLGSVFGVKTHIWRSSFRVPTWGKVQVYRDLTKSEIDYITQRMAWATKHIINKIPSLKARFPCFIELRPKEGHYAGSWAVRDGIDRYKFNPESFVEQGAFDKLLAHELGHPLWEFSFTPKLRARWIAQYESYVSLSAVTPTRLKVMRRELIDAGGWRAFYSTLDEKEHPVADAIADYFAGVRMLSTKFLDNLIEGGSNLRDYWPGKPMDIGIQGDMITEYAKKNATEFFCESFMLHQTGTKLPKPVRILMKQTLKHLQRTA